MSGTTVARSYAEALFALGERHGENEAYGAALQALSGLLHDEPRIRTFLASPKVEPEQKKQALERALGTRVPSRFLNFLRLVIDKRRQRLLEAIGRAYDAILDERLGRVHVQVTLAREVDDAQKGALTDRLSRALKKQAVPHIRVNPQILGGVVLRYEDYVLDGSLRRRLLSLRRRLVQTDIQ